MLMTSWVAQVSDCWWKRRATQLESRKASWRGGLDPTRFKGKKKTNAWVQKAKQGVEVTKQQVVLESKPQGVKGQLDMSSKSQLNFKSCFNKYVVSEKYIYWSIFSGIKYLTCYVGERGPISWEFLVSFNKPIFCRNIQSLSGKSCFSNLFDHGTLLFVRSLFGAGVKENTPEGSLNKGCLRRQWMSSL